MKIQVVADSGQVIDSYEGVDEGDADDVVFGPAIKGWLRQTLRKGATFQEPIIDVETDEAFLAEHTEQYEADQQKRKEDLKVKGERIRAQLAKLQAECEAAGIKIE